MSPAIPSTPTNSSSSRALSTTRPEAAIPTEVREALAAKIEELHGRLEEDPARPTRFSVRSDRAATTRERQALSAAARRLTRQLEPCDSPELLAGAVNRFLRRYEHGNAIHPVDQRLLEEEYAAAVRDLPLWAVTEASERFRSGRTLIKRRIGFRPDSAEFAIEAREGMIPVRAQLVRVNRILNAEVYELPSPKDRAKVEKLADAFRAQSMAGADGRPMPTESEIGRAREAALREHGAALTRSAANGGLAALTARLDAKKRGGRPAQGESGQEFTGEGSHA